jgi:hypothetical protein
LRCRLNTVRWLREKAVRIETESQFQQQSFAAQIDASNGFVV